MRSGQLHDIVGVDHSPVIVRQNLRICRSLSNVLLLVTGEARVGAHARLFEAFGNLLVGRHSFVHGC